MIGLNTIECGDLSAVHPLYFELQRFNAQPHHAGGLMMDSVEDAKEILANQLIQDLLFQAGSFI